MEKNYNTAFLMVRGGCTYFQKAEMVRKAGGNLAIVSLLDEETNPEQVIPISPKPCKNFVLNLTLTFLETENIPPLILINKKDGDLLFKASEAYVKNYHSNSDVVVPAVQLHVDFDMQKYVGNLKVKVWMHSNKASLVFLAGLLQYGVYMNSKINLNIVYRIRSARELGFEDSEIISNYCMLDGKYCVGHEADILFGNNQLEAINFGVGMHILSQIYIRKGKYELFKDFVEDVIDTCINNRGYAGIWLDALEKFT